MKKTLALILFIGIAFIGCSSGSNDSVSGSTALKTLSLSAGTLTPPFSSETTAYTANVSNSIEEVTITYQTLDFYAGVGQDFSNPKHIDVGDNYVTITVTSADYFADPDPSKVRAYTITINRATP